MDLQTGEPGRAPSWPSHHGARSGVLSRLVVGLVPLFIGGAAGVMAHHLGIGRLVVPGPGMWPFVVSALVVLSAIAVLWGERIGAGYSFGRESQPILIVLASLAVFIVLFVSLGFIVSSLLALIFWLKYMGQESWRLAVGMAIGGTVFFQVVFVELLHVPFPDDVIAFVWGG